MPDPLYRCLDSSHNDFVRFEEIEVEAAAHFDRDGKPLQRAHHKTILNYACSVCSSRYTRETADGKVSFFETGNKQQFYPELPPTPPRRVYHVGFGIAPDFQSHMEVVAGALNQEITGDFDVITAPDAFVSFHKGWWDSNVLPRLRDGGKVNIVPDDVVAKHFTR